MTAPFIKWAGGKTRALPAILPLIPMTFTGRYREIFLGGGAVFFALFNDGACGSWRTKCAKLSDCNLELMNAYRIVSLYPNELLDALEVHQRENCEAYFYHVRATVLDDAIYSAARFIYLNRTCFNGLHRVNRAGKFNVPWGKYKSPKIADSEAITRASRALEGVELEVCGFEIALAQAEAGDFVYCDPPYLDPDPKAFTAYSGKFSAIDAAMLSVHIGRAQCRGVTVLLSNADNALTRAAFATPPGAPPRTVHALDVRRSVGASAKTRKAAPEILVECPPA